MPATTINLIPQTDFDQTTLGKFLRWSLTYGRYIIICTEIIVLLAFIYRFSLDRKITDLNEDIEQKSAIIEANSQFEGQFRNLKFRIEQIGNFFYNQDLAVKIIDHLEQITPQGVRFTRFSFTKDGISIDAVATTNSNLAIFLNNLKTSSFLTQINLTTLTKTSQGTGEATFHVDAQLNETLPRSAEITLSL